MGEVAIVPGALKRRTSLLVIGLILIGCTRVKERPTVVILHRTTTEFARSFCEGRAQLSNPCYVDPEMEVYEFESKLISSFATDPSCKGVEIARVDAHLERHDVWELKLSFNLGEPKQESIVFRSDSRLNSIVGNGTPKEIARSVCAIVMQTGAIIIN